MTEFPRDPEVGDFHEVGGVEFRWNGRSWVDWTNGPPQTPSEVRRAEPPQESGDSDWVVPGLVGAGIGFMLGGLMGDE